MRLLVVCEVRDGAPSTDSFALVSHAASLGDDVGALVFVPTADELVAALGGAGARRVLAVEHEAAATSTAARVDAVALLCSRQTFDGVLFPASVRATDLAAALAVRLGAGLNWDLTDVRVADGALRATRPILGDATLADVGWKGDGPALALFRPGSIARVDVEPVPAPTVEVVDVEPHDTWGLVSVTTAGAEPGAESGESAGPRLDEADVIVAGGRGLGTSDGLALVRELAEVLDGVPAVSMPVVSQGWAPYSMQVGQTGTIVKPRLYVACGISGQLQHRVGMERSGTIVAVNTDPTAPIFTFCDVAVVADLNVVVPQLVELLRARRAGAAG
jgi:electron transfer flavoprotein alpha subunit